jgi:site-specific DNA-methyltransferase (adenine-specific)
MQTTTETIFTFIDSHAEHSDKLYLDAVIEVCELWLSGESKPELSGSVSKEDMRKGIQLAVLKGMKKNAQPHHQMTPDSMGILIGHLASKLAGDRTGITLLDPAVGTGNLLYTVMNAIGNGSTATAIEIDDMLIRLAAVTAELLEHPVTFYVQDALRPLLVDPVDITISDLPVGFYPDDDNAMNFELVPAEGHAYAHHLFLEQSMNHTKVSGYGIFLVPANLFDSAQSSILHPFLKKSSEIRAILQLPDNLFKNATHAKSIIVLQKKSPDKKMNSDVLLAKVPTMSDRRAMSLFIEKIDLWVSEQ